MPPLIEAGQQGTVLALTQTRKLPIGLNRVIGDFVSTGKTSSEHAVRGVAIKERLQPRPSQIDRDGAATRVVRQWMEVHIVPGTNGHDVPVIRDVATLKVPDFGRGYSDDAVENQEQRIPSAE
ncbi:hypothetical protein SAMN04490220_8377 [Rhodococcus jostii]|uniref:Uncharacterized protein n=1 Tax=Rhodococcus jostii TaxID=132919 RepID=A0A1H5LSE5_RHOJO|nr:hypothetical protein SAMN04490220_8377 [Rhodococcus jostii]